MLFISCIQQDGEMTVCLYSFSVNTSKVQQLSGFDNPRGVSFSSGCVPEAFCTINIFFFKPDQEFFCHIKVTQHVFRFI